MCYFLIFDQTALQPTFSYVLPVRIYHYWKISHTALLISIFKNDNSITDVRIKILYHHEVWWGNVIILTENTGREITRQIDTLTHLHIHENLCYFNISKHYEINYSKKSTYERLWNLLNHETAEKTLSFLKFEENDFSTLFSILI